MCIIIIIIIIIISSTSLLRGGAAAGHLALLIPGRELGVRRLDRGDVLPTAVELFSVIVLCFVFSCIYSSYVHV